MVLGLVEHTPVQFTRAAIGGDPLEFKLFGIALSLRREQASRFFVSRITARD
jgi:Fe2+ transport system protein FeoA